MGFFDRFKAKDNSGSQNESNSNQRQGRENHQMGQIAWQHLLRQDEFDSVLLESHDRPVLIFKHSTRCIISTMVMRSLEAQADRLNPLGPWYYLDLIAHRDYSNLIAQELGINHESPQLIILHSGKVIWHDSHQGITPEAVMGALSTAQD
jgi:bacillithiol system protein YtxJ